MKKRFTFLLILMSISSGFSQNKEISKILADSLDNVNFEIRLSRIASEHFSEGKVIILSTQFKIEKDGKLTDVKARGPMAELEDLIVSKLKSVMISQSLLEKIKLDNPDLIYALPVRFQIKSESEIIKMVKKDKRKREKEKRKRERKN